MSIRRFARLGSLFACAAAAALAFQTSLPAPPQKFDAGLAAYRAGRIEEALRLFDESEKTGENPPERPFYQGVCHARLGDFERAELRLSPYAKDHPGEARAWYWLGQAQLYRKEFEAARSSMERAVALDAASADAQRTLGEIRFQLKDIEGAYRAWTAANKLNGKDARTTYYLGRLFLEADFLNEAASWFRETLKLAPDHFAAMNYLGICAERMDMKDTALKLYRTSIAESKKQGQPFPWAYVNLAKLLRQSGSDEEAFALAGEAERLCPEGHVLTLLGQMLTARKESVRAEAVLRKAIELDPGIPDAHYALALLLRGSGRDDEARAEIDRFQAAKQAEERGKVKIFATRKGS